MTVQVIWNAPHSKDEGDAVVGKRDYLEQRYHSGLQLLGEVTLEGSSAVSDAGLGADDEGVTFLEGDGLPDDDLGH
jgi:hypothetical protein